MILRLAAHRNIEHRSGIYHVKAVLAVNEFHHVQNLTVLKAIALRDALRRLAVDELMRDYLIIAAAFRSLGAGDQKHLAVTMLR